MEHEQLWIGEGRNANEAPPHHMYEGFYAEHRFSVSQFIPELQAFLSNFYRLSDIRGASDAWAAQFDQLARVQYGMGAVAFGTQRE